MLMGDEKDTWKVKTLDEILQEKKRRRELEESTEPKRLKNVNGREILWCPKLTLVPPIHLGRSEKRLG